MATPSSDEWLALVQEEIIDPDRPIVDPHHHLWETTSMWGRYVLEDLWNDTESGHNVEKTVFIDCRSNYRTDGPEHLRPIGETEFVAAVCRGEREGRGEGDHCSNRFAREHALGRGCRGSPSST